ncbi:hypothetical protein D9C73_008051 [Collichthys lucidus]|uniref:Uncharacterized protein n=1 Tax=Collichthys lucidus TaxID=240159 RepID=A0A4U5UII9_COLLU|nr:hypothetical protein D9C73_008051 [Collichthys lucidus]
MTEKNDMDINTEKQRIVTLLEKLEMMKEDIARKISKLDHLIYEHQKTEHVTNLLKEQICKAAQHDLHAQVPIHAQLRHPSHVNFGTILSDGFEGNDLRAETRECLFYHSCPRGGSVVIGHAKVGDYLNKRLSMNHGLRHTAPREHGEKCSTTCKP